MEAWSDNSKGKNVRQRGENSAPGSKTTPSSEAAKSDVFHALVPIYHISKIFGLCPVKFVKDKTGRYRGSLSIQEVIYGLSLVALYIGSICWGLYRDLRDGWQNSTRLNSETAITVTCSDVFAVLSTVVVAVLGLAMRWSHVQQALYNIVEVDEKLGIATSKNLRRYSIIVVICTLVYTAILCTLDFSSWMTLYNSKTNIQFNDKGPMNYVPLYFMYLVIMTFELQFALVIVNISERFLKLNKTIENLTRTNLIIDYFRKDMGLGTGGAAEAIDQLITLHGTLCDSVIHINKAYGGCILIAMIGCLVHLIITPYFLYNFLHSDNQNMNVLVMQLLWIVFHVYRLLLLVQPCYSTAMKAKITGALVSQALAVNWDADAKKQLEIFSLQLLQRPVEFTVCGLFFLDRGLVTSIAGSVTTYLVILVQFQNADDTKGTKHLLLNATELLKNASTSMKNISLFKS